ncbi:MAG: hypothetical protein H6Q14_1917 [Bacteroidetes bacterium]|nr:hypothetical protein [Bacteroidota bacterium]
MDNNGNLSKAKRSNLDNQFYDTFKALMLEKRIKHMCNAAQLYYPTDFLVILEHVSDETQRMKILEYGCTAHPTSGEMLQCLLDEYIKKGEWYRAESYIDNMDGFVAALSKSPQLIKSYLTICLHTKGYRKFIKLEEALLQKTSAIHDPEALRELGYGLGKVYLKLNLYEKAYSYLAPFEDEDKFIALRCMEDLRRVKGLKEKINNPY